MQLWPDTFLVGWADQSPLPIDVLRRAAVASVEPHAALGGVSAIERLTGWDRFAGRVVVVADRRHDDLPEHGILFRRVSRDRDLHRVVELDFMPTVEPLHALLEGARDLTAHQCANVFSSLRYRCGLQLDDVIGALNDLDRVVGAPRIRAAVELIRAGSAGTKSRSEDELLPHVSALFGDPLVNVRGAAGIPDYEPDFVWPSQRWIVEVDGRHHLEDEAIRAADLVRDELLRSVGWTVVRIPWWWVWRRLAHAIRMIQRAFAP